MSASCAIIDGKSVSQAAIDALDWKNSVRIATTAALPANTLANNRLTAVANGAFAAVDGITLVLDEDILVKDEAAGAKNGIYTLVQVGTGALPYILQRRSDANTDSEVTAGMTVPVVEGTVNANTAWTLITPDPIVLNTTVLTFLDILSGAATWTAVLAAGAVSGGTNPEISDGDALLPVTNGNPSIGSAALRFNEAFLNVVLAGGAIETDGVAGSDEIVVGDGVDTNDFGMTLFVGSLAGDTGRIDITSAAGVQDGFWEYEPNTNTHTWGLGGAADMTLSPTLLTLSSDLLLDSAAGRITAGDGLGTSSIRIAGAGNTQLLFLQGATQEILFQVGAAGDLQLVADTSGTAFVTNYLKASGNWEMPVALSIAGAVEADGIADADDFIVGDGGATNRGLSLFTDGIGTFAVYGVAATADGSFAYDTTTDTWTWGLAGAADMTLSPTVLTLLSNLTLNSDSPTSLIGTGSGSPISRWAKLGAGGTIDLILSRNATTDQVNDKRFRHGGTEILTVEHFNGATWDVAATFDNNVDVSIENALITAGAAEADGIADADDFIVGDGGATNRGMTLFTDGIGTFAVYGVAATADGSWAYDTTTDTWTLEVAGSGGDYVWDAAAASPAGDAGAGLGLTASLGWTSFVLTERADHVGVPTATRSEDWLRSTAPNTRMATDDGGADHNLTPGPTGSNNTGLVTQRWAVGFINKPHANVLLIPDDTTATLGAEHFVQILTPTTKSIAELPTAVVGDWYEIDLKDDTSTADITPAAGDTINGGSAGVAKNLTVAGLYIIYAFDDTDWRLFGPLAVS